MFIFANLINALATLLSMVLNIYLWIIIIHSLLTWVNPDPYNPIVQFLGRITDPVLYKVRKVFPFSYAGGLDFTPLIVILGIYFLQIFLVPTLHQFAVVLR